MIVVVMLRMINAMVPIEPYFGLSIPIKAYKFFARQDWSKLNLDHVEGPKGSAEDSEGLFPIHLPHSTEPHRNELHHNPGILAIGAEIEGTLHDQMVDLHEVVLDHPKREDIHVLDRRNACELDHLCQLLSLNIAQNTKVALQRVVRPVCTRKGGGELVILHRTATITHSIIILSENPFMPKIMTKKRRKIKKGKSLQAKFESL